MSVATKRRGGGGGDGGSGGGSSLQWWWEWQLQRSASSVVDAEIDLREAVWSAVIRRRDKANDHSPAEVDGKMRDADKQTEQKKKKKEDGNAF